MSQEPCLDTMVTKKTFSLCPRGHWPIFVDYLLIYPFIQNTFMSCWVRKHTDPLELELTLLPALRNYQLPSTKHAEEIHNSSTDW